MPSVFNNNAQFWVVSKELFDSDWISIQINYKYDKLSPVPIKLHYS